METMRVTIEVTPEELSCLQKIKGGKTWRKLFFDALGLETDRRNSGPRKVE